MRFVYWCLIVWKDLMGWLNWICSLEYLIIDESIVWVLFVNLFVNVIRMELSVVVKLNFLFCLMSLVGVFKNLILVILCVGFIVGRSVCCRFFVVEFILKRVRLVFVFVIMKIMFVMYVFSINFFVLVRVYLFLFGFVIKDMLFMY